MKPVTEQVRITEIPFHTDLLGLHIAQSERYPFLLESAITQATLGRYDILFAFPAETLCLGADLELRGSANVDSGQFLSGLDQCWSARSDPRTERNGLPFLGGWFIFLGYELAQEIEPTLELETSPDLPVAMATRIPVAIIRDRLLMKACVVAETGFETEADTAVADVLHYDEQRAAAGHVLAGVLREEAPDRFVAAVEAAQRHIASGAIYQANLSREWTGELAEDVRPADLYRRLRMSNPAPFAGIAVYEDFAIVSSSPERLLRARDGRVETRPIAGTRPRGAAADEELRKAELLGHHKERAEHIMLIDLERNDLGRICQAGTVEVDEFMIVESYSHVHHIVSNVTGRLLHEVTPGNMIRAVFPGGSITGCPKVRCMEIIHDLEARPRGAYTGAMGYVNHDGSCDFNILIRTMTTIGRRLSFATGSGIVADSDPMQELEETRAKAKGLLLALDDNSGF